MNNSLKEFLADVNVRQRIAEGKSLRATARENYDHTEWTEAKRDLDRAVFPMAKFEAPGSKSKRVDAGESHETGKETHSLTTFELRDSVGGFNAIWRYNFCPICNKIITQIGVLTNEHENLAYRRHYIRGGNFVNKEKPVFEPKSVHMNKKPNFEKALDDFSTLGGDLDGSD